jgi:ABC-type glycerol-3-phosphate transport system substrate-binding protein
VPALAADEIDVYEYVYKYPTALASGSATPVIPDVWHIAIAFAAASEAAMLLDMPEKHSELEGKFVGYIAERKSPIEESARSGLAGSRRFTPIGMRT